MLGLLVLWDVLKERLFVGEALVAGVALVRLVSLVASRVGLQVRQLGERLRATWQRGKKGSENNFRQEIYHCGQKESCPDFLRAVNCFCRWITSIAAKSVPQQRIFYGGQASDLLRLGFLLFGQTKKCYSREAIKKCWSKV